MSGSAAKETRREVRRAFGDQAALTLERQGAHLTGLGTLLQFEHDRGDRFEKELKQLATEMIEHRRRLDRQAITQQEFVNRSFVARLRWLFRGR
jgi:hypothetical protein